MITAIFFGVLGLLGAVVLPRVWLTAAHNMREAFATEVEYRRPGPDEAKHVKTLDSLRETISRLRDVGFEPVGDLALVIRSSGRVQVVLRALVDKPRTSCVFVAATYKDPVLMFESYSDTQELVTSRASTDQYIEAGPTSQRQFVHVSTSIADTYRKHLELATQATIEMNDLDEVIEAMRVSHDRLVAWRETQPPASLLDSDLRKMLGKTQYRLYGRWLAKRIPTLPRATVRR